MSPGHPSKMPARLPSLVGNTVRRTLVIGRVYLVLGAALTLFLTIVLLLAARASTTFQVTFPLEVPFFAILGATGGLMTFTSDRTKGVFEYLIAYGVPPRTLFTDGLISTAVMSAIILGLGLALGLGGAFARGVTFTTDFWQVIAYYTIPMSFAGALFASTVGMIWSSISSPRAGVNSPVGIAPMVGIGPAVFVLILAEASPRSDYYYITTGAALAIIAAVVILLVASARLMGRERFLSPM